MNTEDFFRIYVPALDLALRHDSENLGYHVKPPEDYIDDKYLDMVDAFIEKSTLYSEFFDMVGIYFDAKSHYFNEIQGEDIKDYKKRIIQYSESIKKSYNLA